MQNKKHTLMIQVQLQKVGLIIKDQKVLRYNSEKIRFLYLSMFSRFNMIYLLLLTQFI